MSGSANEVYVPINAIGANRPAYAVFPPALTRHVIYRIAEAQSPHLTQDKTARDERWAALLDPINDYVKRQSNAVGKQVRSQFKVNKYSTQPDGARLVLASETLLCTIREGASGLPELKVRVDIHTDAFTITHIIDQIPHDWGLPAALDAPEEAISSFYENVWASGAERGPYQWPSPSEEKVGASTRLAEFRGLILSAGDQPLAQPGAEPLSARAKRTFDGLADKVLEGKLSDFLVERARFLHQFLRTDGKLEDRRSNQGKALSSTTEAVLCGMLGGEALYASPILSDKSNVRYLIVFAGETASQLGRFIRRLHTMGELRLYVLFDLNKAEGVDKSITDGWREDDHPGGLRRAGQALRRLGARVTRAFAHDDETSIEEVASISKEYNAVSNLVGGGIIYRTERSQQFSRTFKERLQDLRIVPLAGWQSYDAYVRRYQYQEHEFIAGIGRRFSQLGSRIDRLLFLRQAQYNSKYQETSKDILTESEKTLTGIRKLQERAEDIGLLAGTYYGPQVIVHFLENLKALIGESKEQAVYKFRVALFGKEALVSGADAASEPAFLSFLIQLFIVLIDFAAAILIILIVVDIVWFRRSGREKLVGWLKTWRRGE